VRGNRVLPGRIGRGSERCNRIEDAEYMPMVTEWHGFMTNRTLLSERSGRANDAKGKAQYRMIGIECFLPHLSDLSARLFCDRRIIELL
jgi:hypothetical protein